MEQRRRPAVAHATARPRGARCAAARGRAVRARHGDAVGRRWRGRAGAGARAPARRHAVAAPADSPAAVRVARCRAHRPASPRRASSAQAGEDARRRAGRGPSGRARAAASPASARCARCGWPPTLDDNEIVGDIVEIARSRARPVQEVNRKRLEATARSEAPQGVIAFAAPLREADLDELLKRRRRHRSRSSSPSTGSPIPATSARCCAAATAPACSGVVIPRHRAVHVTPTVAKAAAGAVEHVPMALVGGLPAALARMKEAGIWVVGLDDGADRDLFDLGDLAVEGICLVLGAEGSGLSRLVRERCDLIVSIPMRGRLSSLNVSAAAALATYEIARHRRSLTGVDRSSRRSCSSAGRTARSGATVLVGHACRPGWVGGAARRRDGGRGGRLRRLGAGRLDDLLAVEAERRRARRAPKRRTNSVERRDVVGAVEVDDGGAVQHPPVGQLDDVLIVQLGDARQGDVRAAARTARGRTTAPRHRAGRRARRTGRSRRAGCR